MGVARTLEQIINLIKEAAVTIIKAPMFQMIFAVVTVNALQRVLVEDEKGEKVPLLLPLQAAALNTIIIAGPALEAIATGVGAIAKVKGGT